MRARQAGGGVEEGRGGQSVCPKNDIVAHQHTLSELTSETDQRPPLKPPQAASQLAAPSAALGATQPSVGELAADATPAGGSPTPVPTLVLGCWLGRIRERRKKRRAS